MKPKTDRESDTLYLRLDEAPIFESGVILDFDEEGCLVGIEVLALSTRTEPDKQRIFQLETL
ncbi:MAG: DUF2283 domain-containing protein [Anaerolineae bacterium]|nr:DUF2283 domain-containing protein [Anaerolineae bacterium]